MKKSRVVSNPLNNPKAGYSHLARLEPTAFERRSRRLQLTALEQLSKMLESKARNRPAHKKADTTTLGSKCITHPGPNSAIRAQNVGIAAGNVWCVTCAI